MEGSEGDEELIILESDDILADKLSKAEARLAQLEDEESKDGDSYVLLNTSGSQPHRFGDVSFLGESILEHDKPDEYNWVFEDVTSFAMSEDATIVDVDSVNERCFILCSDMKLTEINL